MVRGQRTSSLPIGPPVSTTDACSAVTWKDAASDLPAQWLLRLASRAAVRRARDAVAARSAWTSGAMRLRVILAALGAEGAAAWTSGALRLRVILAALGAEGAEVCPEAEAPDRMDLSCPVILCVFICGGDMLGCDGLADLTCMLSTLEKRCHRLASLTPSSRTKTLSTPLLSVIVHALVSERAA